MVALRLLSSLKSMVMPEAPKAATIAQHTMVAAPMEAGKGRISFDAFGMTPEQSAAVSATVANFPNGRHTIFEVKRFIPNASAEEVKNALATADHIGEDTFHKNEGGGAVPALPVEKDLTVELEHTNYPMLPSKKKAQVAGIVTRWDPEPDARGDRRFSLLEAFKPTPGVTGRAKTPSHLQSATWRDAEHFGVKGTELTWEVDTQSYGAIPDWARKLLVTWVSFVMGRAVHNKVNLVEERIERQTGRTLRTPEERASFDKLTKWTSWAPSRLTPKIQEGWSSNSVPNDR